MKHKFIFIPLLLLIIGCSGGALKNNVVDPGMSQPVPNSVSGNLPLMVESIGKDGVPLAGSGIMGLFSATIDPVNLSGELVPMRSSALDDAVEMVDISNFLRLAPCTDCVKLMSIELDSQNRIDAKIGIRHPFPAGDPMKPITGRNRADLHVFNVEGTVIFDDSASSTNFSGLGQKLGPQYLANADGYSPYMDTPLDEIYPTQATVHPYILHFDDYSQGNFNPASSTGFDSVTDPPPSGNLVMAMGCDYNVKDYIFNAPPDESFDFIFAVGCTYAISAASKSQRFTPDYQIPQHNKKAASEVNVEVTANELAPGNTASYADLLIKVLDINHGVAVGDARDQMKAGSSVSKIYVEVSGVTSGAIGGAATPTGGNGRDPSNPLTFNLTFHNDLGAGEGTYAGLVKVLDAYPAGLNESITLNGMDAIKRVNPMTSPITGLYALPEFATYMAFTIDVAINNLPPEASFTTQPSGSPDLQIGQYESVEFTSTSTDPDDPMTPEGQIVKYEWDFEWDGIPANFVDQTGGSGTNIESHEYDSQGIFRAGLRVTDNGSPPLASGIYSIEIEVSEPQCGVEVHEYTGTYNITGVTFQASVFLGDIAYFSAGPNAGKVLSQYGYGYFGTFTPGAGDQTMTPFNTSVSYSTNFYDTIDTCPKTGRLFVAHLDRANIWDPQGINLGTWQDSSGAYINATEIDDNGDLWLMVRIGTEIHLRHYIYSETAPYYQIPAAHDTNLTSKYPPVDYWVAADIAIDSQRHKLFVFAAQWSGGANKITVFDISGGNAVELAERSNVFTRNISIMIGGNPYPYYGRRADIEIDHSTPEYCRVLAGANTDYSGNWHYELARLDDQLNTIDFTDNYMSGPGGSVTQMPQALTIVSTGTHPMIAIAQDPQKFFYFECSDW